MVLPLIGAALTLGGTILGARAQKKQHAIDSYNNSPQGIRANAEAAGFNPLVFVGPGTGTGAQYAPQFGSTIANGLAGVGNALDAHFAERQQLDIQRSQLELEKQRLEQIAQRTMLAPNIPGIYGNAQSKQQRRATSGASTQDPARTGNRPESFGAPVHPAGRYDGFGGSDYIDPKEPISILGAKFRGTGTTSKAEKVEEDIGDVGGSIYGIFSSADYLLGTYNYNIHEPLGRWGGRVQEDFRQWWNSPAALKPDKPRKRPKARPDKRRKSSTEEYQDYMREHYPTVYD